MQFTREEIASLRRFWQSVGADIDMAHSPDIYEYTYSRLTPCPTCHSRHFHLRCFCGGEMCGGVSTGVRSPTMVRRRGWLCKHCGLAFAPDVCGSHEFWLDRPEGDPEAWRGPYHQIVQAT